MANSAHSSRPWRDVDRELFTFATTDRRDLHIAIMTVFEEGAVLRPSMTFDQIRFGLASRGWDEPLEDAELDRSLGALVEWRLLEATQDHSARYATPEEFERRNLNWSLSHRGVAAISGLLHSLQILRRTVSLQPAVLDAIADALAELHRLATEEERDRPRVATRLAEVESHLQSLVSNVRQFNSHLQRLLREDATSDEIFLDVKERTVVYLQEFVSGVERPMRRVAIGIARIDEYGIDPLLQLALEGANLAPIPGEDPSVAWLGERRKHWGALRAWFLPEDESEARFRMLELIARQAIVQLLRVLERRWDARRRSTSIPQDFRTLASWFASASSEAEAHRLFNASFGLWPARHAHLPIEDSETVPSTASWLDAPPVLVAPSLRTSGSVQHRGRPDPVGDPASVRARRQFEQAKVLARSYEVRAALHTETPLRLSTFEWLDPETFGELLNLLGHALSAPRASDGTRRGASSDGQVEIVLTETTDGHGARIETSAGVLFAPDFEVQITLSGVDVITAVAAGG